MSPQDRLIFVVAMKSQEAELLPCCPDARPRFEVEERDYARFLGVRVFCPQCSRALRGLFSNGYADIRMIGQMVASWNDRTNPYRETEEWNEDEERRSTQTHNNHLRRAGPLKRPGFFF